MMMMVITIVEKRNLFLKREIHYGPLEVGKEENIVDVVLIELSLNFFWVFPLNNKYLKVAALQGLWVLWQILIPKILHWTELCFTKLIEFIDYEVFGVFFFQFLHLGNSLAWSVLRTFGLWWCVQQHKIIWGFLLCSCLQTDCKFEEISCEAAQWE